MQSNGLSTASNAVLSTTELLESILIRIDAKTLLVAAQRVSKRWHDVIKGSQLLQKKLFLLPTGSLEEAVYLADGDHKEAQVVRYALEGWHQNPKHETYRGVLNPLLFATTHDGRPFLRDTIYEDASKSAAKASGSWTKMQIIQPPQTLLLSYITRCAYGQSTPLTLHIRNGESIGDWLHRVKMSPHPSCERVQLTGFDCYYESIVRHIASDLRWARIQAEEKGSKKDG